MVLPGVRVVVTDHLTWKGSYGWQVVWSSTGAFSKEQGLARDMKAAVTRQAGTENQSPWLPSPGLFTLTLCMPALPRIQEGARLVLFVLKNMFIQMFCTHRQKYNTSHIYKIQFSRSHIKKLKRSMTFLNCSSLR